MRTPSLEGFACSPPGSPYNSVPVANLTARDETLGGVPKRLLPSAISCVRGANAALIRIMAPHFIETTRAPLGMWSELATSRRKIGER
jgi:hypothetical protein